VNEINSKVLGRGLSSLISEANVAFRDQELPLTPIQSDNFEFKILPLNSIIFFSRQPRKTTDHTQMEELVESIREHGVLQPIIVRKIDNDTFQIVAGERRYQAAKRLGLRNIPGIIREYSESHAIEVALVENIQREELSALEEAFTYAALIEDHNHTQESLAKKLGKSRSYVANIVRLTKLPKEIVDMLAQNQISPGHARTIVNAEDPIGLAKMIIERDLSVRETERLMKKSGNEETGYRRKNKLATNSTNEMNPELVGVEKQLQEALQAEIKIKPRAHGYQIHINCKNLEELDEIIGKLNSKYSSF